MQERILIAPNGTEFLRMLARNGISTLGLRIMQPLELAQFALMRSGLPIAEKQITPDTEAVLIWRFLKEIPYFQNASCHDAQDLADALRMLRLQITEHERESIAAGLRDSPFAEKNAALLDIYDRYAAALQQEKLIDAIGVLRRAVSEAKQLPCECMILREYPLALLEQALADRVSNGTCKTISLCELLQKPEKAFTMPQITESYGAANEVEAVIGSIYRNKLPLDQCTIAVTDTAAYAPLLFEYAARFAIPVTFGCGLPVTMTQPACVLRDYRNWLTSGHCGIDALTALICGSGFDTAQFLADFGISGRTQLDRFLQTAGNMRLSNDAEENRKRIAAYQASAERDEALVSQLNAVFVEMGMGCTELIRRYAKIRKNALGKLDTAARNKICDRMERFAAMTDEPAYTLISDLLQVRICPKNSREGMLHITTVSGTLTCLRQNLFVMGLSAEQFPGEPRENYVLLDNELSAFGAQAPTSLNRIRQTQEMLHHLLKTAATLNVRTELSYCGYDTAELKANNASSVLYALYLEAGGTDEKAFNASIRHTGYFSQELPGLTEIGRAYLQGEKVAAPAAEQPEPETLPDVTGNLRFVSPSSVETFLTCPKMFCYEKIMGMKEPEQDDVFQVISPIAFGNLAHEAMAYLYRRQTDKDEFLKNAEQIFERFLAERPPMNQNDAEQYRHDFMQAIENGFDGMEGLHIEEAEQTLTVEYECSLTVSGRLDALAKMPDGTYRVIDYKTGKKISHTENDLYSCIQVILYADMLSRSGKQVQSGEYRYLRSGKTIPCNYTPDRAERIQNLMNSIADAMRTNQYPANASKDNCKYCPYIQFCEEGSAI